jgi:hypothetical protein
MMADKELFYASAATHFQVLSCVQNLQCKQNYTGEQVKCYTTVMTHNLSKHVGPAPNKLCTPHPQNLHLRKA